MTAARIKFVCTVVVTAMLSCCLSCGKTTTTKELTESSARALIEQSYSNNYYPVSLAPLAPLFAKTRVDYKTFDGKGIGSVMRVFLERGLVEQTTETISYPKLSGTFSGETHWKDAWEGTPGWNSLCASADSEYTVEMDANSNTFSGTHTLRNGCLYQPDKHELLPRPKSTQKIKGTIEPDGRVSVGEYRQVTLVSEQVGLFTTNGTYNEQGTSAHLKLDDLDLTGKATGQKVDIKWYTYALTPEGHKQIEQTSKGMELRGGKFKIGEVTHLRLVTDTIATANFAWEGSLNDVGKTLLQYEPQNMNQSTNEVPKGVGTVAFGKKPDGTWFIDRDSEHP